MKALVIKELGKPGKAEVVDVPEPAVRPTYIKVKATAFALNPTDWQHLDQHGLPGCKLGCDYSGIVEEIGPDCHTDLKQGDYVFGICHGANLDNKEDGSFSEFVLNKDGILGKKPEGITFEQAASLGVAVITCGMAIYQYLGLPLPRLKSETPPSDAPAVLIYGGSTATGLHAIQYAKLSGCKVLTTSSPHNFDLLRSLGADACFDYRSPTCGADIRAATNDSLTKVLDCIATPSTAQICADALASELPPVETATNKDGTAEPAGFHMVQLEDAEVKRPDIVAKMALGYTAIGEAFHKYDQDFEVKPQDYEFAKKFCKLTEGLLAEGRFKPVPVEVREGGLAGIGDGLQQMREGKVSGKKLVYRMADTPGL